MKKINFEKITLNMILVAVIIFLAIIILATSIFVFVKRCSLSGGRKAVVSGNSSVAPSISIDTSTKNIATATLSLGQSRILLKNANDEKPVLLVVSTYFEYDAKDFDFLEELLQKKSELKKVVETYFSQFSKDELHKKSDVAIKDDLVQKINENLTLNKITNLYFSEYLFVD